MTAQVGRNAKRQDYRLGPQGEHAVPRKRDAPITEYIETDSGTFIISEHPTSAFISVAGGKSMFLDTEEKIAKAIATLRAIRRRAETRG